ncbi:hypothetical protein LTR08_004332 [Meristemomyces frigidus]|nr:hypothetical protein LTR08_004332 [Meristemomyces frigidus]
MKEPEATVTSGGTGFCAGTNAGGSIVACHNDTIITASTGEQFTTYCGFDTAGTPSFNNSNYPQANDYTRFVYIGSSFVYFSFGFVYSSFAYTGVIYKNVVYTGSSLVYIEFDIQFDIVDSCPTGLWSFKHDRLKRVIIYGWHNDNLNFFVLFSGGHDKPSRVQ